MVARRAAGEPLQYVLGRWGFRTLDLFVDRRVLIPRPETEVVAGRWPSTRGRAARRGRRVVDLGTGSGAIALSIAAERWPDVEVWATDASADALAVARANLAGLGRRRRGRAAGRGRLVRARCPTSSAAASTSSCRNPPYVAADDALPAEVADWEPRGALVPGPTGLEAIERHRRAARRRGCAPAARSSSRSARRRARPSRRWPGAAGFATADVQPDLAGRDRALVAGADCATMVEGPARG